VYNLVYPYVNIEAFNTNNLLKMGCFNLTNSTLTLFELSALSSFQMCKKYLWVLVVARSATIGQRNVAIIWLAWFGKLFVDLSAHLDPKNVTKSTNVQPSTNVQKWLK